MRNEEQNKHLWRNNDVPLGRLTLNVFVPEKSCLANTFSRFCINYIKLISIHATSHHILYNRPLQQPGWQLGVGTYISLSVWKLCTWSDGLFGESLLLQFNTIRLIVVKLATLWCGFFLVIFFSFLALWPHSKKVVGSDQGVGLFLCGVCLFYGVCAGSIQVLSVPKPFQNCKVTIGGENWFK